MLISGAFFFPELPKKDLDNRPHTAVYSALLS